MNWLFLRGQVPQDRDPSEIIFDKLDDSDDMWTQLFYEVMSPDDYGEIWYWNGERKHEYYKNYVERYIPDFRYHNSDYTPDVIFARGGFQEYDCILRKYPKAYKIYYGAGKRYYPTGFLGYNLILVDTEEQKKKAQYILARNHTEIITKPAAKLFEPKDVKREYDICYIANGGQADIKGIEWVYRTVPRDLSVLHLGLPSKYAPPDNVTTKRVLRSDMPYEISKCRVGIVPYGTVDSCPRAIPEMVACGLQAICFDTVNVDFDKYGLFSTKQDNFWKGVEWVSWASPKKGSVSGYYKDNLSLKHSAREIRGWME